MGVHHAVNKVVDWLRQGYPQGVPQEDYIALLGILRRELTLEEIEYVAEQIAVSGRVVSRESIRSALEAATLQVASAEDIQRVSGALAAGGWPLADIDLTDSTTDEASEPRVNPVVRFIHWIRLGYPGGVPDTDYQPLLALLHHRLPDTQVDEICDALITAGLIPADRIDVAVEVSRALGELPNEAEVVRVLDRLKSTGWPVVDDYPVA